MSRRARDCRSTAKHVHHRLPLIASEWLTPNRTVSGGRGASPVIVRGRARLLVAAALLSPVMAGCSDAGSTTEPRTPPQPSAPAPSTATNSPFVVAVPPEHGRFSYQIGGAFPPPVGVSIVARDHSDPADPAAFSICYINAFQAQPDAVGWWTANHPNLLLRDSAGDLVMDREWDEPLLDISTERRRTELLDVVGGWIDGCAARGYRAVEADNLDSYTRSQGRLTVDDAMAYAHLLADRAHRNHLSLGQKNAADQAEPARRAGFDFAIAEECQVYAECDAYTAAYGAHVIEIEYTDQPITAFTTACRLRGKVISVVLRDRAVAPPADTRHVERWCP